MAQLYLCGGEIGYQNAAPAFVRAANAIAAQRSRPLAQLALLLQGSPDPYKYVPRYIEPWLAADAGGYTLITPDANQQIDQANAIEAINKADAILVGGGNTAIYRRLYATGPLADAIRARVESGMPYCGISAGMLIACAICPLDPEETGEPGIQLESGLGLLSGVICEPHFTAEKRLPCLLEYLALANVHTAWGVDDSASVVVENGRLDRVIGGSVYQVQMTDFDQKAYQIKVLDCR